MWKYCKNCGNKLDSDSKFCNKCGFNINENINNIANNNINKTTNTNQINSESFSGMAIAGLVLAILGFILMFINTYFGIFIGLLSLSLAATAQKHMKIFPNIKGDGLATAAFIIGIIDIALSVILWIIMIIFLI